MIKLITILTILSVLCSGCTTPKPGSVQPLVNTAVLIAANQYARKNPDNVGKILDIALILELAANASDNSLTKEQFVALVQRVDSEWAILGVALYNYYEQNVIIPQEYSKHSKTLRDLATTLRDSVLGVVVDVSTK